MTRFVSLFSQLLSVFNRNDFDLAVKQHQADRYAKGFSCWQQFVAMIFCQVAKAASLREICYGLASCGGKMVHLGLREAPRRSTLSYANEHCPWELYQTIFEQLLATCQPLAKGKRKFRFKNKLYSIDASVIDLCLSMYDWAKFRRTKGAVKIHLTLDHHGYLPCFAVVTPGRCHEVNVAKILQFPQGAVVVMDRGYNDYGLFGRWTQEGVFFVTRMKRNACYRVVERREVPQNRNILSDEIVVLTGVKAEEQCPHRLRRIAVWDPKEEREIVLLTNHLEWGATTIAAIYKDRWQIELFFKALKQNLRIKTFVGTNANAVKTQIWTALITMLLLKYLQFKSQLGWSLSTLVAVLRWFLFTYRDLWAWLDTPFGAPPPPPMPEQLLLPFMGLGQQTKGT